MTQYFKHKMRTKKFGTIVGWIILGIIAAAGFAFLLGSIVMLLWNWLMPLIFGLGIINYWQAVGIIILAKILFGGFGHHKSANNNHNFKEKFRNKHIKPSKSDFEKWKFYDKFWKEKGEEYYNEYVENREEKEKNIN